MRSSAIEHTQHVARTIPHRTGHTSEEPETAIFARFACDCIARWENEGGATARLNRDGYQEEYH